MTKAGLQISVLPEKEVCKLPVILLLSLKRTMFCFVLLTNWRFKTTYDLYYVIYVTRICGKKEKKLIKPYF